MALSSLQDRDRISLAIGQLRSSYPITVTPCPHHPVMLHRCIPHRHHIGCAQHCTAISQAKSGSWRHTASPSLAHSPCYQGEEGSALDPLQADGDEKHPSRSRVGICLLCALTSAALKKSIRNFYKALEIGVLWAHTSHLLPFSSVFPPNPSPLTQSELKSLPLQ